LLGEGVDPAPSAGFCGSGGVLGFAISVNGIDFVSDVVGLDIVTLLQSPTRLAAATHSIPRARRRPDNAVQVRERDSTGFARSCCSIKTNVPACTLLYRTYTTTQMHRMSENQPPESSMTDVRVGSGDIRSAKTTVPDKNKVAVEINTV
jgi:hypothetical protein